MKQRILNVIVLLLFVLNCGAQVKSEASTVVAEQQITAFYKQYMSMIAFEEINREKKLRLTKSIFTPRGFRKYNRYCYKHDFDALINAQDSNEMAVKTVACKHLKDDWYQVSYLWDETKPRVYINLKLKYEKSAHKFLICEVQPLGDDL